MKTTLKISVFLLFILLASLFGYNAGYKKCERDERYVILHSRDNLKDGEKVIIFSFENHKFCVTKTNNEIKYSLEIIEYLSEKK